MVTFELFARPLLDAGRFLTKKLTFLHARLKSDIKTKTGLTRFLPAVLSGEFEHAEAELARWEGRGHCVHGSRQCIHCNSSRSRENSGGRMGGGFGAVGISCLLFDVASRLP